MTRMHLLLTLLTSVILEYIKLNNKYDCILYLYPIYVNMYVYLKMNTTYRPYFTGNEGIFLWPWVVYFKIRHLERL